MHSKSISLGPVLAILFCSFLAYQPPLSAQDNESPKAVVVKELQDCRNITDDMQRLSCYDEKVAAFAQAEDSGELLVAEKEVVDKARRDIFGLSVSDNPLFTGKNQQQLDEIVSKIIIVSKYNGKWAMTLEDGSTWRQTDTTGMRRSPKKGDEIVVSRGILGSFNAKVEGRSSVKVIRVR